MAKISATEQCVFRVDADAERAYEFFSQPQLFRVAMHGVLRCEEQGNNDYRWLLEKQSDQGVQFQPDYVVNYVCDGSQSVRWSTRDGNLRNEGEIKVVSRAEGGSDIHYCETIEPDLPITPLLMKLVKPLVKRELCKGLKDFVERSQNCLSN